MACKLKDFKCLECGLIFEELVMGDDEVVNCPSCNKPHLEDIFIAPPSVRTDNNSASFVDGTSRKGFKELKESYELLSKSYEMPVEKRNQINKEISRLRRIR